MNNTYESALKSYARTDVETGISGATPEALIVMLYDGAIRAVTGAHLELIRGNISGKCEHISRAMRIIEEGLICALDPKAGGDVADNLGGLYEYMCDRLMLANLRNDPAVLEEVRRLLVDLREAWSSLVSAQARQAAEAALEAPARRGAGSYGRV